MYAGVPMASPVAVSLSATAAASARAIPKSATIAPAAVKQNVFGLDVAMDDAPAMRMAERAGHLPGEQERVVDGQLLLARDPLPERLPPNVGHRVPEAARQLARVEHR